VSKERNSIGAVTQAAQTKEKKEEGKRGRAGGDARVTFSLRISLSRTKIDRRTGSLGTAELIILKGSGGISARAQPLPTHVKRARARACTRIDIRAMLRLLMRVFGGGVVAV